MKTTKSDLPLFAVSYLQSLANGNPRMVSAASNYFYQVRDQFDSGKIKEEKYLNLLRQYIDDQLKEL
jgi:hypothetical protein